MKENVTVPLLVFYFCGWVLIGLVSWVLIKSRSTPKEKKVWFDRMSVTMGIFVVGCMCLGAVLWKQYVIIPFFVGFGALTGYLNVRFTFFCDRCGKKSTSQNWFSPKAAFHCPNCGNQLR